ncbi:MAG: hypothetical protein A3G18_04350 [Rhodospirillales bacterium RIFCSPLOWO2_12_FULL_58_28]|nr:MAG: hypothetical protein A3H92_02550 [Rhodospirillales bacterium RIFCSPLOWO2_02_FULL_58_16]OHC77390.1 MAG: hypothetical protein A3G18_04350 [Rhodospirillales bacterium RIFCSPLOWO2_12_FULL_58_28]
MKKQNSAFSQLCICAIVLMAVMLSSCVEPYTPEELEAQKRAKAAQTAANPGIFSDGGMFGGGRGGEGSSIGVNSFLWRASLDTISFMPVSSVDPFGGVIITDWHSAAEAPNERFKLNIYILGRALRADGIRVAVFRQVQGGGSWKDAPVPEKTGASIEDAILVRARQLRNETLQQ